VCAQVTLGAQVLLESLTAYDSTSPPYILVSPDWAPTIGAGTRAQPVPLFFETVEASQGGGVAADPGNQPPRVSGPGDTGHQQQLDPAGLGAHHQFGPAYCSFKRRSSPFPRQQLPERVGFGSPDAGPAAPSELQPLCFSGTFSQEC
jgi:hypothetical protein